MAEVRYDREMEKCLEGEGEFVGLATTTIALEIIEAFVRKFSVLPQYGDEALDKWFREAPIARKHVIMERRVQTGSTFGAYVFYRGHPLKSLKAPAKGQGKEPADTTDPKIGDTTPKEGQGEKTGHKVIVKPAFTLNYLIEGDDYEPLEAYVNVNTTQINGAPQIWLVEHWKLKKAWDADDNPLPDRPEHTWELWDEGKKGDNKSLSKDEAKAALKPEQNRFVQEELGIELYTPISPEGYDKIPIVLFKNEYERTTIFSTIYPILEKIADVFREMFANMVATGPFWLLASRGATANNSSAMVEKLGKILTTHATDDGQRSRFVILDQNQTSSRYETMQDAIADLSTNPAFEPYIQLIEYLTERAKKAVMAPVSSQGDQGTKNLQTAEVGQNNANSDDTIALYKRMRTFEWTRFGQMWYMAAGLDAPEDLQADLPDLETQNDKIMAQKKDQENAFGKEDAKMKEAQDESQE